MFEQGLSPYKEKRFFIRIDSEAQNYHYTFTTKMNYDQERCKEINLSHQVNDLRSSLFNSKDPRKIIMFPEFLMEKLR